MKVYGWQGWRNECRPAKNGDHATRKICAAKSMAAVARAAGVERSTQLFNLTETGDTQEVEAALARPGVVLWRPLDDRDGPYVPATEVPDAHRE